MLASASNFERCQKYKWINHSVDFLQTLYLGRQHESNFLDDCKFHTFLQAFLKDNDIWLLSFNWYECMEINIYKWTYY